MEQHNKTESLDPLQIKTQKSLFSLNSALENNDSINIT